MAGAIDKAEEWVRGGDWGTEGARVQVTISEVLADGSEGDSEDIEIDIEPDHAALISETGAEDSCGNDPDDHDWTSEGEGGCDSNPGVYSLGGTRMQFKTHCRRCGLRRIETVTGAQHNPEEHDTVEYLAPR